MIQLARLEDRKIFFFSYLCLFTIPHVCYKKPVFRCLTLSLATLGLIPLSLDAPALTLAPVPVPAPALSSTISIL